MKIQYPNIFPERTHIRTHGQAQGNKRLQLFQS